MSGHGGKQRGVLARLGRRALVAAALGLVMTVTVAWASAAWAPTRYRDEINELYRYKAAFQWHTTYRHRGLTCDSVMLEPDLWAGGLRNNMSRPQAWTDSARDQLAAVKEQWPEPFDVKRLMRRAASDSVWAGVVQDAQGWPVRALWCEWDYDATKVAVPGSAMPVLKPVSGGIPLKGGRAMGGVTIPRALPYRPMWRGLVMDVVVWGGMYFVIVSAVSGIRRWRRTRRGWCPECAYDLHGQAEVGCSECGWKREAIRRDH